MEQKYKTNPQFRDFSDEAFGYEDNEGCVHIIENGEETWDIIVNAKDGKYHVYPRGPNFFWDNID